MMSILKQVQLIKLKDAIQPCYGCLCTRINDTIFYFQAEKSSTSHKMSKLFESKKNKANEEDIFQSDDDKAGNLLQKWKTKKQSL